MTEATSANEEATDKHAYLAYRWLTYSLHPTCEALKPLAYTSFVIARLMNTTPLNFPE